MFHRALRLIKKNRPIVAGSLSFAGLPIAWRKKNPENGLLFHWQRLERYHRLCFFAIILREHAAIIPGAVTGEDFSQDVWQFPVRRNIQVFKQDVEILLETRIDRASTR